MATVRAEEESRWRRSDAGKRWSAGVQAQCEQSSAGAASYVTFMGAEDAMPFVMTTRPPRMHDFASSSYAPAPDAVFRANDNIPPDVTTSG